MDKIMFSSKIAWQLFPDRSFAYACNFETRKYYMFEDTGLEIWLCIAENEPIGRIDIQSKIAEHYKVEFADIEADIDEFLTSLLEEGLVSYNE